ncbi:type II secretion system protein [Candidatus Uhrbacteria bacterium]|nr:type II secretion system protein [Candidatus Uhrbacteria bacterium]
MNNLQTIRQRRTRLRRANYPPKADSPQAGRLQTQKGFTLIEIIIAVGILALLAGVVVAAVNPARQFALARNTQRVSNINELLSAVGQRMAENKGTFHTNCAAGAIPTTAKKIASGTGNYDIASCLSPTYISVTPVDPSATGAHYTSTTDYDTGYTIIQDVNGRITISAPSAELGQTISATR